MSPTGRNKDPLFLMRHYGALPGRVAELVPLREKLHVRVECDFREIEARMCAWLEQEYPSAVHRGES